MAERAKVEALAREEKAKQTAEALARLQQQRIETAGQMTKKDLANLTLDQVRQRLGEPIVVARASKKPLILCFWSSGNDNHVAVMFLEGIDGSIRTVAGFVDINSAGVERMRRELDKQ
jgi:hypothetical protein